MRRQIAAIALTSMLMLGLASLGASAASASTMPAEGVFEDCPIATQMVTCLQRLETMHAGGVNVVVLPIEWATPDSISTYADVAHSMGMSVMWWLSDQNWWDSPSTSTNMDGYYQGFVSASGQTENGPLLSYIVHYLGALPGTYGYYAADDSDLVPGDGPAVANYTAQIRAADPSHPVMIGSGDQTETDAYQHSANMIGAEIYPVTDSSLMPVSDNQGMWDSVAQGATDAQQSADNAGNQSAFILQAFTWGDNLADGEAVGVCTPGDTPASCYAKLQYPTSAAQLQLRNEILTHAHPSLILWWSFMGTYGQAGNDTYDLYPTGAQAAAQWAGLQATIQAPAPSTAGPTAPTKPAKKTVKRAPKAHAASRKTKRHGHKRRHHTRRHHRRAHHTLKHRHGRRFLAHAA
jgi:hypothetical protein